MVAREDFCRFRPVNAILHFCVIDFVFLFRSRDLLQDRIPRIWIVARRLRSDVWDGFARFFFPSSPFIWREGVRMVTVDSDLGCLVRCAVKFSRVGPRFDLAGFSQDLLET